VCPAQAPPPRISVTERARFKTEALSKETSREAPDGQPAAVAGVPAFVFALDRDGLFTASDGRGFASRGVGAGGIVGHSAGDFFRDVSVMAASGREMSGTEAVQRALAGETIHGKCELAEAAFDFRLLPYVERAGGEVAGVVGVATEIGERVCARPSITGDVGDPDDAREQLLRADRLAAIGTLAAGAAHEINNPLTYAMINAEHVLRQLRMVVAEGRGSPDSSRMGASLSPLLDSLVQAIDGMTRIRDIVRNLMTFSQGTVEAHGLVDVRSVVESSIQMALHEIVHRARLVRDLAEVPPVEASEARLGQVFLNLIVNAAQAIPEGDARSHEVRVATYTNEAGDAVIEVGDTGVGIAPEMLPRVFDPFFTSKGPGQGVGLGLSISLGTVKSLGGDIRVASEPERGTVFRVVLPSAKGWRTGHPAPPSEAVPLERKQVIIVDDDRRVGDALERALSGVANVESTTDARAVLDRLASGERWDVILCDLLMPETSGMDLYREALRVAPDAAACIVFMTAGAFTSRARAFLDGVRNPCLEKPLDLGKLRSLIARAGRWQRSN
jgi:signal transduction histidine kinase